MPKIIAILNQKGGVGKTTTAINLATYLAKLGKKILIIDLDPQSNATSGLGVDKLKLEKTIFQVLMQAQALEEAIIDIENNLKLIPSNADLAGAEIQLVATIGREFKLRDALTNLAKSQDVILIDCPPSLGLLTVNALVAATDIIIPVQAEYYAMEGLSQLLQIVQRVQQGLNPNLQMLGLVITMYDSRTVLSEQVRTEVEKAFGTLLFKTVIPRNVRLAEAPSHGKSIVNYDKWSKGARAYKNLAKEVNKRVS